MTADALVEMNDKLGIQETWLSQGFTNDEWGDIGDKHVEEAFRKYPTRIRGMGAIILGRDHADKVREFKDRGFFGLKTIYPMRPYDDPANDEIWQEAQKLKMPITFHGCLSTGFHFDLWKHHQWNPRWHTPDRLMRVAYYFPELVILIAHMGNTDVTQALAVAMQSNVYLDCSGGYALKQMPKTFFDQQVYWSYVKNKMAFGTDQHFPGMPHEVEHMTHFVQNMQLSQEDTELMWHGNAEKIIAYCTK
jgi:predicted TIM-barrel fold metal-dependent hydrolase